MSVKRLAVIVGAATKYADTENKEFSPIHATWGLGGGLSIKFAQEGYHAVLLGRRKELLDDVVGEITKRGFEATAFACDVGDDKSVTDCFTAIKKLGNIEVLVYNVGGPFPPGRNFPDLPLPHGNVSLSFSLSYNNCTYHDLYILFDSELEAAQVANCMNIAYVGFVRCIPLVVPEMLERKSGTILISNATMGLRGGKSFSCMAPAKAALRSLGQRSHLTYNIVIALLI